MDRRTFLAGAAAAALPGWARLAVADTPLAAALREAIPEWMHEFHVPGASIALIEEGRPGWSAAFGIRDQRKPAAVDAETIFEAASMSKPLFAYAVLKLVEDGVVDLDRPLDAYLPEPYAPGEPAIGRITARMVLNHTTGLPNWRRGDRTRDPLYLVAEPGSRFTYSGEGFMYLQTVVEALVGERVGPWLQETMLNPLGMQYSSYTWRDDFAANYAHGHDRGGQPNDYSFRRIANTAASLYTTPGQYARFASLMIRPPPDFDGRLGDAALQAMLAPASVKKEGFRYGLGWGLCRTLPGRTLVYHGGANGSGHRCLTAFDRETGSGFVLMSNGKGGASLRREVVDVAFPKARLWEALGG